MKSQPKTQLSDNFAQNESNNIESPKNREDFFNDANRITEKLSPSSKLDNPLSNLNHEIKGFAGIDSSINRLLQKKLEHKSNNSSRIDSLQKGQFDEFNQLAKIINSSTKPTDDELVDMWIDSYPETVYGLGAFRRLKNGVWNRVPDDVIGKELMDVAIQNKWRKVRPTSPLIQSCKIIASYKTQKTIELWNNQPNIIPCKNGLLDVESHELLPFDTFDKYFSTGLNCNYDPEAKCPTFLDFLDSTIPHAKDYIQDFLGICLTKETKYEIISFLIGPSGSGKSTLIAAMRDTLGSCAGYLGLDEMEKSSFTSANTPGKYMLYMTEKSNLIFKNTNYLNRIASGEAIIIDQKNERQYEYFPFSKIILTSNTIPRFYQDNGLSRRSRKVFFPDLPDSKRDINLKRKIAMEIDGILNFALAGLRRVYRNDAISPIEDCNLVEPTMRSASSIADAFVAERCNLTPDFRENATVLYDAYVDFCKKNHFPFENKVSITLEWKRLGLYKKTINGHVFWVGIKLNPE